MPVGEEAFVRTMTALPPSIRPGVSGTPQPRNPSLTALLYATLSCDVCIHRHGVRAHMCGRGSWLLPAN